MSEWKEIARWLDKLEDTKLTTPTQAARRDAAERWADDPQRRHEHKAWMRPSHVDAFLAGDANGYARGQSEMVAALRSESMSNPPCTGESWANWLQRKFSREPGGSPEPQETAPRHSGNNGGCRDTER